jgi:hypothetical protein
MKNGISILLTAGYISVCLCQSDTDATNSLDPVLESVLDNSSEEVNQNIVVEDLEYLQANPIDILHTTYSQLITVPFISSILAEKILLFTDSAHVTDLSQLKRIPEITDELFTKISPFLAVDNSHMKGSLFSPKYFRMRTRGKRRLQDQKGFTTKKYFGNEYQTYNRIWFGNESIETSFMFDKDAGELNRDGFAAGYIMLRNIDFISKVVAGNYSLSVAQGLLTARNISVSKGDNVIAQVKMSTDKFTPSASTDEYRYYRGIAVELSTTNFSFIPFYSDRELAGTLDNTGVVSSFYTSGLFRDSLSMTKRNVIKERISGGIVSVLISPTMKIGAGEVYLSYDKFLSNNLYNLHGRKSLSATNIFTDILLGKINLYGEIASNDGIRFSHSTGISFYASRELALNYHHRSYSQGYVNPLARPFGERGNIVDGELGNYAGIILRPLQLLRLSLYVDSYTLPYPEGRGIIGTEYFADLEAKPVRNLEIKVHVKTKERSQVSLRESDDNRSQTNYRFQWTYMISSEVEFSQRVEHAVVQYDPSSYSEKGIMNYFEVRYQHKQFPLSVRCRMSYFETDSYDSRVYQYESDVRGSFSNPPLYGKGNRWYILLTYELWKRSFLSLHYSETKKLHEYVIGTGDDEIIGNLDNQLTLQIDFEL